MKIHELISFVEKHTEINKLIIESYCEGKTPYFEGSVIELLETQYLFLDVPVENAAFDSVHKILNIFYDPANL